MWAVRFRLPFRSTRELVQIDLDRDGKADLVREHTHEVDPESEEYPEYEGTRARVAFGRQWYAYD